MGSLDSALAHALDLIDGQPALALEQATEILKTVSGHPIATLVVGMAQRRLGDPAVALDTLEPLVRSQPQAGAVHFECGLALADAGQGEAAVGLLRRAVELSPALPGTWQALADHLTAIGDTAGADAAYARHIKAATRDPRLLRPAAALCENDIPLAETLLREHLCERPTDVAAIRMFAEVAARLGRYQDAENLLARCLELAPGFHGARHNYAVALFRQGKHAAALPEIERLLAIEPRNPNYRSLHAAVLAGVAEYARAIDIYVQALKEYPRQAKIWLSYGHVLKTSGAAGEGIGAYRRALELEPRLGEAWWSLANLKTYRFDAADMARMRQQLARADLAAEDRYHFHFALGKALEDEQRYADSFEHYRQGNALRRAQLHYDPERSSHPQVEGTMELPDVPVLAHGIGTQATDGGPRYPQVLETLSPGQLRALGEEYLARTRIQRKTGRPYFIDKLPNNFLHVGFIHLMLPNARIIDARRHPLSGCFSAFKQHFARGQNFTYDLAELGAYYRSYVELMAHFDAVLPGRVHRVFYERLVDDTEHEVRRLLEYCGLPFEPACLRFYENERAVRTASSEQVRVPIYREGLEQWRHYEAWLEPLKRSLGAVLERYPQVPDFTDPPHDRRPLQSQ
ncbi:MAG: tetratricopeptide repeat protein [Gammaproteobacteria bacterium]|nr:MAG: tetratricopeptide repeat protein [Gammaproteobacteria bacterium]